MAMHSKKYGLVTRSDIDGLMCAILLKELGILDSIKFVHPKDVQDGKVQITENDILTNLPYVPQAHLCFDHHASEEIRTGGLSASNYILKPGAASTARVLYNYYGGVQAFPNISEPMLEAVDKADSANFSKEEILNPKGWVLMSFL